MLRYSNVFFNFTTQGGFAMKLFIVLMLATMLALALIAVLFGGLVALALIAILSGGLAAYVVNSIARVDGSKEKVVVFRFGKKQNKVLTGGLHFRFWLIDVFKSFPTGLQQLHLGEARAFSKEKEGRGSIKVSADISLKFKFPDGDELSAIAHLVKNPWDEEELKKLLGPDVREICKEILSRFEYDVAYSNLNRQIDNAITAELQKLADEHIIRQLNLQEVAVQVIEVGIPEAIEHARAAQEIAQRDADARRATLDIAKRERKELGEAEAEALKKKRQALGPEEGAIVTEVETTPDGSFKGKRISLPDEVVDAIDEITGRAAKNVGKGIVETLVGKAKKLLGNDEGAKKS